MKKMFEWFEKTEKYFLFFALLVMVISSFTQVLNRNLFELPIPGIEEIAKYCMVYVVMLGTEIGLRDGTQIRVTVLTEKLNDNYKLYIERFVGIILIVFSGLMLKESVVLFFQQIVSGQTSPGLKLPMSVPYFSLCLGFFIIFITQAYILINSINKRKQSKGVICQG